jgi:toxin ParE1/3/4
MPSRIEWRPAALNDMVAIVSHIAQDNPTAARNVYNELHRQSQILSAQPDIGRPGRIKGTRELVFIGLPYVAPYRITKKNVEILRVYHTAQEWGKS